MQAGGNSSRRRIGQGACRTAALSLGCSRGRDDSAFATDAVTRALDRREDVVPGLPKTAKPVQRVQAVTGDGNELLDLGDPSSLMLRPRTERSPSRGRAPTQPSSASAPTSAYCRFIFLTLELPTPHERRPRSSPASARSPRSSLSPNSVRLRDDHGIAHPGLVSHGRGTGPYRERVGGRVDRGRVPAPIAQASATKASLPRAYDRRLWCNGAEWTVEKRRFSGVRSTARP